MHGVPDGYIPEETAIRPHNVIPSGPHLPPVPDHAPRLPVSATLLVLLWYDRYKEQHQASRWSGWYDPSSFSTSAPDSSACRLLSPFKIAAISRPNLQIREWSFARSQRVKTVSLTILNVASDIHAFSLAPCLGIRDISP